MGARSPASHEPSVTLERSSSTDEELLELIQDRDQEALLILFRRYNRLTFSIGCRILRDAGEAEDLVQEVFLRLHARENTFDPKKDRLAPGWSRWSIGAHLTGAPT